LAALASAEGKLVKEKKLPRSPMPPMPPPEPAPAPDRTIMLT
jgi:hypothetical protein